MTNANRGSIYKNLESQFLRFADLKAVNLGENNEMMQSLKCKNISFSIYADEMTPSSGTDIWVRSGVIERLKVAQSILEQSNGDLLH